MFKRPFLSLLLLLLVTSPLMVSAHSFEWGVEVGDEFTYALQRKILDQNSVPFIPFWMGFVEDIDEGSLVTVTITELDQIPETITLSDYLPLSHATITASDNTTLENDTTAFAILIGDWELQGEFLNKSLNDPERTWIDSDEEWGLIEDSAFSYAGQIFDYYYEWRYFKTDGTLSYARYRVTRLGTALIDIVISQWHEGDPTVIPPELQLTTILIAGIAVSVGIIVAILVYRWVKTPRGLAAQLGR